jgi:hypothetical protein
VTDDEELTLLEDNIRKLKIEYDVYFSGGSKKPPDDSEWRVRNTIKKYSDGRALNFPQQFRYNTLAQKFAVFSDLWRRKLKIKEEGYRRPQDALLAIQGLRPEEEHEAAAALGMAAKAGEHRSQMPEFEFADPGPDLGKAQALYDELVGARQRAGMRPGPGFDSFHEFLSRKTSEIRRQFGCATVQFSVELENGEVKLKARGKH